MGNEEDIAFDSEGQEAGKVPVDDRKWVGVRLSKVMMTQVEEAVRTHPEWAWSSNNDFVRDAVRRLLENVRKQDAVNKQSIATLPKRILDLTKDVLDEDSYSEFRKKMLDLLSMVDIDREPADFLDSVVEILATYLGESLAKKVIGNLYEGNP